MYTLQLFLLNLVCSDGWTYFPNTGQCYRYFNQKLTWTEARAVCQNVNGGDLVSIHNKETNDFLYPLPRTSPDHHYYTWIGARRADEHSDWRWSDGSSWDYSNWGTDKPTNLRTDDYGGINGGKEYVETRALGFWDNTDNTDDDRGAGFLCQYSPGKHVINININTSHDPCFRTKLNHGLERKFLNFAGFKTEK